MDGTLDNKPPPRISIRDGQFRCVMDGRQEDIEGEGYINIVVVNAASIARTFYAGSYDPHNPSPPYLLVLRHSDTLFGEFQKIRYKLDVVWIANKI